MPAPNLWVGNIVDTWTIHLMAYLSLGGTYSLTPRWLLQAALSRGWQTILFGVSLHRLQFTDHNISVDKSEVVSNVGEVSHLLHPPLGMPLAPHPSSPSMLVAHLAGGNQVTVSPKHLTVHPDASLWKITLWVYLILLINFNWFQIHLGAYKKPETYGIHIARLFWKTFHIM